MRIVVDVNLGGVRFVCNAALTQEEKDGLRYLAGLDDFGVAMEHVGELVEEFVIVNFGQPDAEGYVSLPDDLERELFGQVRGAMETMLKNIRASMARDRKRNADAA